MGPVVPTSLAEWGSRLRRSIHSNRKLVKGGRIEKTTIQLEGHWPGTRGLGVTAWSLFPQSGPSPPGRVPSRRGWQDISRKAETLDKRTNFISKVGSVYICKICRISTCHYSAYSKRVCIFSVTYLLHILHIILHILCHILHIVCTGIFLAIFCILFCTGILVFIFIFYIQGCILFAYFLAYSAYICPICRLLYIFYCIFCIFQWICYIFSVYSAYSATWMNLIESRVR